MKAPGYLDAPARSTSFTAGPSLLPAATPQEHSTVRKDCFSLPCGQELWAWRKGEGQGDRRLIVHASSSPDAPGNGPIFQSL